MNLSIRNNKTELLDEDDISFDDLQQNLIELEFINKWLGGHTISWKGFRKVAGNRKKISLCEIGTGGGDNLAYLIQKSKEAKIELETTGIDLKADCIRFAKKNTFLKNTDLIQSNFKDVDFKNKPDIIFSSLFCHHFSNEELVGQIRWMTQNSKLGFFINDLERNILAYQSIGVLTKLFSKSYLVRNDAPLSVARALKKEEWKLILKKAGLKNYTINRQWAFRFLISFIHAPEK